MLCERRHNSCILQHKLQLGCPTEAQPRSKTVAKTTVFLSLTPTGLSRDFLSFLSAYSDCLPSGLFRLPFSWRWSYQPTPATSISSCCQSHRQNSRPTMVVDDVTMATCLFTSVICRESVLSLFVPTVHENFFRSLPFLDLSLCQRASSSVKVLSSSRLCSLFIPTLIKVILSSIFPLEISRTKHKNIII